MGGFFDYLRMAFGWLSSQGRSADVIDLDGEPEGVIHLNGQPDGAILHLEGDRVSSTINLDGGA